ncbi:hypothetical protein FRB90_006638, partial [Tulasnella sp. 427]
MSVQASPAGPAGSSPSSLSTKFESVKTTVLDILNDTTWPPGANDVVRDFSRAIEDAPNLKNIPDDDATIPKSAQDSLENLIRVMEDVKPKLEKASRTYGERNRGLRSTLVHFSKSLNKTRCPNKLGRYKHEVEAALALLPSPDGWVQQPTSGGGSSSLTGPTVKASTTPPTLTPLANVQQATSTPTAGSTPAPSTPAIQQSSPSVLDYDKGKRLGSIKTTLDLVEGFSGTLPVVGSYVGAAAKVGKLIVQTIQNVETNESACADLEAHASRLSQALKMTRGRPTNERKAEIETALRNVQSALQDLRETTERVNSKNAFKAALFADVHREALKDQKEKVRTALEVMD